MFDVDNSIVDPEFSKFYLEIEESEDFLSRALTQTLNNLNSIQKSIGDELLSIEQYRKKAIEANDDDELDRLSSQNSSWIYEEVNILDLIQQQKQLIFILNYSYFEIWFKGFYIVLNGKYQISNKKTTNKIQDLWKDINDSFKMKVDLRIAKDYYDHLNYYGAVRNCIMHCKSDIRKVKDSDKNLISVALGKLNKKGVSINNNLIILDTKFIEGFKKCYNNFFVEVQTRLQKSKSNL